MLSKDGYRLIDARDIAPLAYAYDQAPPPDEAVRGLAAGRGRRAGGPMLYRLRDILRLLIAAPDCRKPLCCVCGRRVNRARGAGLRLRVPARDLGSPAGWSERVYDCCKAKHCSGHARAVLRKFKREKVRWDRETHDENRFAAALRRLRRELRNKSRPGRVRVPGPGAGAVGSAPAPRSRRRA